MNNSPILSLYKLYKNLQLCFINNKAAFELARLIDEYYTIEGNRKFIRSLHFEHRFGMTVLSNIKKEALKYGRTPIGNLKNRNTNFIKQKIDLAIRYLTDDFKITHNNSGVHLNRQEIDAEYEKYVEEKSMEGKFVNFICSYCGCESELNVKNGKTPLEYYCPYCGKLIEKL